jgi:mRNA interferase MazF
VPAVDGRLPDAGDIVWLDFGLPIGHEQGGRRPALVVSPASYNEASSLMLVCPITRNEKSWPFKVRLTAEAVQGFVLVDHVRAIDPAVRFFRTRGRAGAVTLAAVRAMLVELVMGGTDR